MEGIERIKQFLKEEKDANIKKVAEYLINRTDMDEKYLNEEKNLTDMWVYVRGEAQKKAVNNCAVLEDQDVYNLAIHYFDETNEALGIKKTQKSTKNDKKQDAKTENNASNTEQDAQVQQKEKKADVPTHKDDDIVMKYKGRAITYKEFKDGTYLQLS